MSAIPVTAVDLIKQLDKFYPERSPSPEDNEREIWIKAGERRLVRKLMERLQAEEKKR